MSSVYCTAPFNGLTIREDGHVRTCCNGSISLGNLNYESIEDKLISFNDKMDEPLPVKEVMSTVMQTVRKKIAERDA